MYEKWNEQSDIVNPAQCHGMSHSERHGVITLRCTPSQQQSPPRSLLYISSRGSPANLKLFEISMLVREERGGMVVGKTWICQRTTTTTTTTTTIAEQHWNRPFDEWKKTQCAKQATHIQQIFLAHVSWALRSECGWPPLVTGHFVDYLLLVYNPDPPLIPAGPGFIKNYLHYPTLRRSWKDHKILQSKCLTMVGNIMKYQDRYNKTKLWFVVFCNYTRTERYAHTCPEPYNR